MQECGERMARCCLQKIKNKSGVFFLRNYFSYVVMTLKIYVQNGWGVVEQYKILKYMAKI